MVADIFLNSLACGWCEVGNLERSRCVECCGAEYKVLTAVKSGVMYVSEGSRLQMCSMLRCRM